MVKMKNIQTEINSTLNIAEEKIRELENKEIENIQNKSREKRLEKRWTHFREPKNNSSRFKIYKNMGKRRGWEKNINKIIVFFFFKFDEKFKPTDPRINPVLKR